MRVDYCYHTHTFRCGHASGSDREYVEFAIKNGIKVLGFSDHIFIPGFEQKGIRGSYKLIDDYTNSIRALAEEFKDKIEVKVGFEAEYADCLKPYYRELLKSKKIDYLICGQHMNFSSPTKGDWFFNSGSIKKATRIYTRNIIKAIKSGLFLYIAHPDLFMMKTNKYEPCFERATTKICKFARKYDIPLEINIHGILNRKKHQDDNMRYPCKVFFEKAVKMGCKIIIGIDAHNPIEFEQSVIDEISDIIEMCRDNLIDRLNLGQ